jgi:5-methyltetrahydrofolate--homocysteine methyltransferase
MVNYLEEIKKNIIAGRIDSSDEGFDGDMEGQPGVVELVEAALQHKVAATDILTGALNPGMEEVGSLFEREEYLIPDMLASAECVSEAMQLLEPELLRNNVESRGKFVLATVQGDLHDIGKNIIATMLKGSGYKVIDLGTSVPAAQIVEAVKTNKPAFLGLSALLTTTMGHMQDVIAGLHAENLRDSVKILIGGAPVSEDFSQKIGADYYCEDVFDTMKKLGVRS